MFSHLAEYLKGINHIVVCEMYPTGVDIHIIGLDKTITCMPGDYDVRLDRYIRRLGAESNSRYWILSSGGRGGQIRSSRPVAALIHRAHTTGGVVIRDATHRDTIVLGDYF